MEGRIKVVTIRSNNVFRFSILWHSSLCARDLGVPVGVQAEEVTDPPVATLKHGQLGRRPFGAPYVAARQEGSCAPPTRRLGYRDSPGRSATGPIGSRPRTSSLAPVRR